MTGAEAGAFATAEAGINTAVQWLRLAVESLGAAVIAVGVVLAAYQFLRAYGRGREHGYTQLRLTLARYLAVALEFQLAADILSTAVAPSWDRIGKLAAIAIVRTGLNYFLGKEIDAERASEAATGAPRLSPDPARETRPAG